MIPLLEPLSVLTDEQRLETFSKDDLPTAGLRCTVVFPGDVDRYDRLPLQYEGFCPVALLSGGKPRYHDIMIWRVAT